MKKLLLLVVLLSYATLALSQELTEGFKEKKEPIEVGSVNPALKMHAKLLYYEEKGKFMLLLRNISYDYAVDLYYIVIDTSEVNSFYNLLTANLGMTKTLEKTISKSETLSLSFKGNKVAMNLWDGSSWKYSMSFSRRQIENLFGDYTKYLNN